MWDLGEKLVKNGFIYLLVKLLSTGIFLSYIAQKMQLSIKDFFSKYDQIRRKLRMWSVLCSVRVCFYKLFLQNWKYR